MPQWKVKPARADRPFRHGSKQPGQRRRCSAFGDVCFLAKSGRIQRAPPLPLMTHSGHFVVRTLREEYGPNFADAVGGAFRSWIWPRSFETA